MLNLKSKIYRWDWLRSSLSFSLMMSYWDNHFPFGEITSFAITAFLLPQGAFMCLNITGHQKILWNVNQLCRLWEFYYPYIFGLSKTLRRNSWIWLLCLPGNVMANWVAKEIAREQELNMFGAMSLAVRYWKCFNIWYWVEAEEGEFHNTFVDGRNHLTLLRLF